MRARAAGTRGRHRRVHAELPGFVARRAYDTAVPGAADDDGLTDEVGIVELFDRRVERVQVDVQDARVLATGHVRTTRSAPRAVPWTS